MKSNGFEWVRLGAILGGLGVIIGAFGAHGLEKYLDAHYREVFETGVKYQMYHALAMVAVGLLGPWVESRRWLNLAGVSFLLGVVLFSGSLYALAITQFTKLGMIAPLGGLSMIAGWLFLAVAVSATKRTSGAS